MKKPATSCTMEEFPELALSMVGQGKLCPNYWNVDASRLTMDQAELLGVAMADEIILFFLGHRDLVMQVLPSMLHDYIDRRSREDDGGQGQALMEHFLGRIMHRALETCRLRRI